MQNQLTTFLLKYAYNGAEGERQPSSHDLSSKNLLQKSCYGSHINLQMEIPKGFVYDLSWQIFGTALINPSVAFYFCLIFSMSFF